VALQGTDVFTYFSSCVLSCCQVSLNCLVQNPEGVGGVICVAGAGSIPYLWQLVGFLTLASSLRGAGLLFLQAMTVDSKRGWTRPDEFFEDRWALC
jgi:hypothetical protein